MQKSRLIKGEVYVIEGHPHFYQGHENGTYRFLRWDGSLKYVSGNNLNQVILKKEINKVQQDLQNEREESAYYKDNYLWHKEQTIKQNALENSRKVRNAKWFSESRFAKVSLALTFIFIIGFAINLSFEAGTKSGEAWIGIPTFIFLFVGSFFVSLLVSWICYKADELIDSEKRGNIFIKLLFILPILWFFLYRILQFIFRHN